MAKSSGSSATTGAWSLTVSSAASPPSERQRTFVIATWSGVSSAIAQRTSTPSASHSAKTSRAIRKPSTPAGMPA